MQALLDQYLNRVSVNRATLKALFAAGDTDSDGLLDRPQAKGALLCALPSLSDTVLTAIWLEREKVCSDVCSSIALVSSTCLRLLDGGHPGE